jgi:DNA-binding PadR family transcriptional regulator
MPKKLKSYILTDKQKEEIENAMNFYEERFKFYMEQIKLRDIKIKELEEQILFLSDVCDSDSDSDYEP